MPDVFPTVVLALMAIAAFVVGLFLLAPTTTPSLREYLGLLLLLPAMFMWEGAPNTLEGLVFAFGRGVLVVGAPITLGTLLGHWRRRRVTDAARPESPPAETTRTTNDQTR